MVFWEMKELEIHLDNVDNDSLALSRFELIGLILINKLLNIKSVTTILKGIWLEEVVHYIREIRPNK